MAVRGLLRAFDRSVGPALFLGTLCTSLGALFSLVGAMPVALALALTASGLAAIGAMMLLAVRPERPDPAPPQEQATAARADGIPRRGAGPF
jgi:hypothetical protein